MHRIDSSTATPDNRFTEGDPTIPIPATTVTAAWLNAMQEEAIAVLAAAEIAPDKGNNAQMLAAILDLIADSTPLAKVGTPGLVMPDGTTITIDANGKISAAKASQYELGEVYYFRHPTLRPGFQPCQGGIITDAATKYPQMWAYLQTAEGQLLLKTEADWQAMSTATWATLADGTKVGWNGIGGAPYFVQDLGVGTLRMPDLRGMYAEAAGFDSLGVGGVHGDVIRNIKGAPKRTDGLYPFVTSLPAGTVVADGALTVRVGPNFTNSGTTTGSPWGVVELDASRTVPTGNANKPRAWGALACAYLGTPAL